MTLRTESDQVLFSVVARLAAKLLVVDFQVQHRAARLTTPPIATQHSLAKVPVRRGAKYQASDVATMLLLDTVVVECWRQGKALEIEMAAFEKFNPVSMSLYIPNLRRYRTASQRALTKSLELLTKKQLSTSGVAEGEADTSTLEAGSSPQTP
jgi:hypothetical protein